MLPKLRARLKSGIARGPQRVWPRHEAFVRRHLCSVPGCEAGPIEFAHYRTADNSGTGIKPPSWFGLSLCSTHYAEQHQIGQPAFEEKYVISMERIARAFADASPDFPMRSARQEEAERKLREMQK